MGPALELTRRAAQILLLAAGISFVLAYLEEGSHEEGLRAYIEPLVIVLILILNAGGCPPLRPIGAPAAGGPHRALSGCPARGPGRRRRALLLLLLASARGAGGEQPNRRAPAAHPRAVVGVWQESNAEAALDALKELQSETARVIRDGKLVRHARPAVCRPLQPPAAAAARPCRGASPAALAAPADPPAPPPRAPPQIHDLPAKDLVPGDLIELAVGDRVPADVRIVRLKTATLRAEQASLTGACTGARCGGAAVLPPPAATTRHRRSPAAITHHNCPPPPPRAGEPVAVLKSTDASDDEQVELQGKECMLFSSTGIANGSCVAIVTSTGMKTEIGKIQSQIQQVRAPPAWRAAGGLAPGGSGGRLPGGG
jgi:hypothetical protein